MAEVSSCLIHERFASASEESPEPVRKGEELGYFQYGGSTRLLIFRRNVVREFLVARWV